MKKILTVALMVCVLFSLALCAFAEDAEVTVGQKFEWNGQKETPEAMKTWGTGGGVSPDGLWRYEIYVVAKKMYIPVVHSPSAVAYAWNQEPGVGGLGWARVRDYGNNFHPGETADIVKSFTFPSGGKVTVDTTIRRASEWVAGGSSTPTSLAIYLDDQLVWPTAGEYEVLSSAEDKDYSVDLTVSKNQRLYIRIGCVDGNYDADAVIMSNYVTYKSVSDDVVDPVTTTTEEKKPIITNTVSVTLKTEGGANVGSNDVGSNMINTENLNTDSSDGSGAGLIIGIVAGVAVVAAVVVVVILKKKK